MRQAVLLPQPYTLPTDSALPTVTPYMMAAPAVLADDFGGSVAAVAASASLRSPDSPPAPPTPPAGPPPWTPSREAPTPTGGAAEAAMPIGESVEPTATLDQELKDESAWICERDEMLERQVKERTAMDKSPSSAEIR